MNHWVSLRIVARSFWFSITEQQWLKIQAMFCVLQVAKFHFHQLFASTNLFVFHIVIQFHYLAVRYLLAMADGVFTVQRLQHRLTM
jgi:hypothetical protein